MLLSNKTIFIVEDNPQNRVVFKLALVRHGAQVEFERWGQNSALQLRSLPHVDLIILDLMLADNVSGFDVFDEIRRMPKFEKVPIVAASAMDPALAIPKVQAKGFAAFVPKPIDNVEFPKLLVRVLNGEQIWTMPSRS